MDSLVGLYYASVLQSTIAAIVAVFGLVYGIYIGYLGITVDGSGDSSAVSYAPTFSDTSTTSDLYRRVASLESLLAPQLAEAEQKESKKAATSHDNAPSEVGNLSQYIQTEIIGELNFDPKYLTLSAGSPPRNVTVSYQTPFNAEELDISGLPEPHAMLWSDNPQKAIREGRAVSLKIAVSWDTPRGRFPVQIQFSNSGEGKGISGIVTLIVT